MWRIPPPNSSPLSKCPPFFFCMKLVTFASMVNGLSLEIIYSIVYDKQEAQLSQRDRAYIEHFAKSHKFTQGHSKRHCWVGHVYVPISIQLKLSLYIVPFWDIERQKWRDFETGVEFVEDHWKWRRSTDHIRLWTAIANIALTRTVFELFAVE